MVIKIDKKMLVMGEEEVYERVELEELVDGECVAGVGGGGGLVCLRVASYDLLGLSLEHARPYDELLVLGSWALVWAQLNSLCRLIGLLLLLAE